MIKWFLFPSVGKRSQFFSAFYYGNFFEVLELISHYCASSSPTWLGPPGTSNSEFCALSFLQLKTIKRLAVGVWGSGEEAGKINRWRARNFAAVKILCRIPQWLINVSIYFSKPLDVTTPRVNLNINYRLLVLMMCPCRFSNCNKYTALVGCWAYRKEHIEKLFAFISILLRILKCSKKKKS